LQYFIALERAGQLQLQLDDQRVIICLLTSFFLVLIMSLKFQMDRVLKTFCSLTLQI